MKNHEKNNYNNKDSRNDRGIVGSFQILFLVIFVGVFVYLQIEYEILTSLWEIISP